MKYSLTRKIIVKKSDSGERITELENEIDLLEKKLQGLESDLNGFESQIRSILQNQILRIRELTALYKEQKQGKKKKRVEQKKKGKNYKEPLGIKKLQNSKDIDHQISPADQQKLKRLYKEAIVHVHPDKFAAAEDQAEKANSLTVQLNSIYESGNMEALSQFHEHIISGNAMSHVPFKPESLADPQAMMIFLKKKKQNLVKALEEISQSQIYIVLSTRKDPLEFVEELREQFAYRISQLEKRTRTKF
ncbi:MAG TPA: hypothetical protein VNW99_06010 [Cytophagaceae bacterium]|nr:hypothetical protein [Cytophagaceae bacterium]